MSQRSRKFRARGRHRVRRLGPRAEAFARDECGGGVRGRGTDEEEETDQDDCRSATMMNGNRADVSAHAEHRARSSRSRGMSGTVEEEEIEEEEADLAHYVEDLEEDASFEELEEETHAAGEHEHPAQEIAASAEVASVDQCRFRRTQFLPKKLM